MDIDPLPTDTHSLPCCRYCQDGCLEDVHNYVHGEIGGCMGDVPTAAFDPLFFFHHCNVDRVRGQWMQGLAVNVQLALSSTCTPAGANGWHVGCADTPAA